MASAAQHVGIIQSNLQASFSQVALERCLGYMLAVKMCGLGLAFFDILSLLFGYNGAVKSIDIGPMR